MERLQLRRWLDAELVGEPPTGPAKASRASDLTASTGECGHQLTPSPLANRIPCEERLERRDHLGMLTPGQEQFVELLLDAVAHPRIRARSATAASTSSSSSNGRPRMRRNSTSVRRHGGVVLAGRRRPPGCRHVVVEADHVELDMLELQAVSRRPAGDDLRPERVPHAVDVSGQRLRRRGRNTREATPPRGANRPTPCCRRQARGAPAPHALLRSQTYDHVLPVWLRVDRRRGTSRATRYANQALIPRVAHHDSTASSRAREGSTLPFSATRIDTTPPSCRPWADLVRRVIADQHARPSACARPVSAT